MTPVLIWHLIASAVAFALFGIDKHRARRNRRRIAEFHLCLVSALGGWPGGMFAMLLFRHKTAKGVFLMKYTAAVALWACVVGLALMER